MIRVESLDQEGRGVAHADGKVIFIQGALPGELVTYASYSKKPSYEVAQVTQIVEPAPMRVTPRCPHFGTVRRLQSAAFGRARAGGSEAARARRQPAPHRQGRMRQHPAGNLRRSLGLPASRAFFGSLRAEERRALIGFREKRSSYVTDMTTCAVVPPRISALLVPLRELINGLSRPERLPQIELAIGDDTDALVLRTLEPLSERDGQALRDFADRHRVQFFVQPRGPDTAVPFYPPHEGVLYYKLPEFGLELGFSPTEFTQVNAAVNRVLVRRAMTLLAPQPGERIADMFCGLGNFTLAIARSGARVAGFEGARSLVARAQANAARNGLADIAEFHLMDLFKIDVAGLAALGHFDRMLIDPPRDGAVELIKSLSADAPPRRIVYISCNAATLARDAGVLVHVNGYALTAAGVVNMFPHTSHVESIAVFDRS
jgi:23S rRNA (uracil1939-C5)-methyltransferase